MKFLYTLFIFLLIDLCCFGQSKKYSPAELKDDLHFLKQLIENVHVNPYSELSSQQYDQLYGRIAASLTDSSDASEFMKKIKPVIAYLSDEHSQINLEPEQIANRYREVAFYIPFSLKKIGAKYFVDSCLSDEAKQMKDQAIISINNQPVENLLQHCALATTGFPGQRMETALRQFGYLYPWAVDKPATAFSIKTASKTFKIKGVIMGKWLTFNVAQNQVTSCDDRLTYAKVASVGYINACSFDVKPTGKYSADSIKQKIDGIFAQLRQDKVDKLVIDVSRNEGGNSLVGDYLIGYIYDKPYKGYQTDFKRSDEYLKLLRSWKFDNPAYAAESVGKVLHYPSQQVEPLQLANAFKGKTYIVIGGATFSSAMTFATEIKDNHIAQLIGQTPLNGHPDGFGEMYYTKLPYTQVFVRFGVKEYIRPAGKQADNTLRPDVALTDAQMRNAAELVKTIEKR
jgi:C-terminal processing protease CtpA/Prc